MGDILAEMNKPLNSGKKHLFLVLLCLCEKTQSPPNTDLLISSYLEKDSVFLTETNN